MQSGENMGNGTDGRKVRGNRGGVERVMTKLHGSLDRGDFYEAHQMYRTVSFRYFGQNKFGDTLELLYDGAVRLMDIGQKSSGADLALLFVEKLLEAKMEITENWLGKLEQLFARLPIHAQDSEDSSAQIDREKFIDAGLNWSKTVSKDPIHRKRGHPGLHGRLATVLWSEKCFPQARYHFMLSDDGDSCASFLVEYQQTKGYQSEMDLFIAQAVLQYLCHQKKAVADTVFTGYTERHPAIKKGTPPFAFPLLNFLWLLLMAIDVKRIQQFTVLIEKYKPSIERDPVYFSYLDKIGQIWFGLPPKQPQKKPGGFLANLLQGFMDQDDEDEMMDSAEVSTSDSSALASGLSPPQPSQTMKEEEDLD